MAPCFFSQHVLICSAVETTSSIFLLTTLPQSWHLLALATADPFPSRASVPHGKGPKKGLQESITRNEPPGPPPPIHHQDLLQPCPETRCSGEHVRCHAMYRPQTTKKEGNIAGNSEAKILRTDMFPKKRCCWETFSFWASEHWWHEDFIFLGTSIFIYFQGLRLRWTSIVHLRVDSTGLYVKEVDLLFCVFCPKRCYFSSQDPVEALVSSKIERKGVYFGKYYGYPLLLFVLQNFRLKTS